MLGVTQSIVHGYLKNSADSGSFSYAILQGLYRWPPDTYLFSYFIGLHNCNKLYE